MSQPPLITPDLFESLQAKIDDDTNVRELIKEIVQSLEKAEKKAIAHITNAHSLPEPQLEKALSRAILHDEFLNIVKIVGGLQDIASKHPYYKFNGMWTRAMQDAVFIVLLLYWHLGPDFPLAHSKDSSAPQTKYRLATLDETADLLKTIRQPPDGQDEFHLTTEEYLHGMISLLDELARLSRTSVTLGDYKRPLIIARFVKDVHAGFGLLNLKNDSLRKRGDGIKYKVRETEDVVYDLSLRGLASTSSSGSSGDVASRAADGATSAT